MYPATVRTFRTAGFQWITQFAYDPIDMAAYNTEYQTHYLNVAYTPNKAIGLMIAAEAAQKAVSYTRRQRQMCIRDRIHYSMISVSAMCRI